MGWVGSYAIIPVMDKTSLIQRIEESRDSFLEALEGLPDEAYLQEGVIDRWTVKDVLSHMTMWEAQIITLLFRAPSSPTPNTVHFSGESTDEINERWFKQNRNRPLDQVLTDFDGIRTQTIRRLDDYTDQDLNDVKRFPWLGGSPLWKWVAEETFEHDDEHKEQIAAWRKANKI